MIRSQDTFLQHYFKINTTAYVDAFGEAFFGKYAKPNQHILKTWATDDEFVRQLTSGTLFTLACSVCTTPHNSFVYSFQDLTPS